LALIGAPTVTGQSEDLADAVFKVQVWDTKPDSDGHYHGHEYGTAFFINTDGTAITNSHVVYRVAHEPDKYRIMAFVGKEFCDATVMCASKLPYDPTKMNSAGRIVGGATVSKDVAKIKLAPSTAAEGHRSIYYKTKDGQTIPLATAHLDTLPEFPFLTIGGAPSGMVKVIGFGDISANPYKWSTTGQVDRTYTERYDGTAVFDIEFQNPAAPGNSGSPVLNDQNQVVGLWTWHYYDKPTKGTAQQSSVLKDPCN
jgi:hypothetical protein